MTIKAVRLTGMALLAMTAGLLTGCSVLRAEVPEPEQLYCTWSAPDGAEVDLGMYGHLVYRNLPVAIVEYPFVEGDDSTVSGEGTWS